MELAASSLPFLSLVSTWLLGLFVGALLAEGAILVPYWRAMDPSDFFALHHTMGPRLYAFFRPLTILGSLLPAITAVLALATSAPGAFWAAAAGMLSASMIGIYFLYFAKANASFADKSLGPQELPRELARWAKWHWFRVVVAAIAFGCALLALLAF